MTLDTPQPDADDAIPQALGSFARAVWAKLGVGAALAALSALVIAAIAPLRAILIIEHGPAAIGLTLWGVALAASPMLLWMSARVLARGPSPLNPLFYWLFFLALGAGGNTLALLFLRESVVSVFALASLGFGVVYLAHRLMTDLAPWLSALLFGVAGAGGAYAISAVLNANWVFTAFNVAAIVVLAAMMVSRAGAFARIRAMLKRPHPKAGVTFAAMHLIALTEAPQAKQGAVVEERAIDS